MRNYTNHNHICVIMEHQGLTIFVLSKINIMKFLRTFFLLFLITIQITAQEKKDTLKESGMMMPSPDVIAKPAFDGNSGNFNLTVWVMEALNEKRGRDVSEDSKTGSHNIIVEVNDAEKSKEIPGATVKVMIVSPSGKKSATELESMMNNYRGNISLDEKGEYQLNINVEAEGFSTLCPVVYNVK